MIKEKPVKAKKERIDVVLVDKGNFPSREKAKAAIMAGVVFVNNQKVDKPGTTVNIEDEIFIKEDSCPFVGRGGFKLAKALEEFQISLVDLNCVDMGASTGGFTDCMLQNGAAKVYAIDVGYGQLDYKLRIDPRVINIERTNIRYMDIELVKDPISFISIDVSFISLNLIFPVACKVLQPGGKIVALAKPQFEAGKEQVGKNGIIKDEKIHQEVINKVIGYGENLGLKHIKTTDSPIKGAKGNKEFLLYFEK